MKQFLTSCFVGMTCTLLLAGGTVSETQYTSVPVKVTISWTSDTNGVADGVTSFVRGEIKRVVIDPDGSSAPTASYDITLKDESGFDVLAGLGADLSATASISIVPFYSTVIGAQTNFYRYTINDVLTLAVTNAGSEASGTVVLYLKK